MLVGRGLIEVISSRADLAIRLQSKRNLTTLFMEKTKKNLTLLEEQGSIQVSS